MLIILLVLSGLLYNLKGEKPSDCRRIHSASEPPSLLSQDYSNLENDYDVNFYFIDLEITNISTFIKGSTTIKVKRLTDSLDVFAIELSDVYQIDSINIQNFPVTTFTHLSNIVLVPVPLIYQTDTDFTIKIYYNGQSGGNGFFNGISNVFNGDYQKWVTYTLSEPFQANEWFPCKQNLLDKADSAWIFLTTDSSLMAGSNGLLTNVSRLPDGRKRYEWKTGYPIAYYLISFSVADYVDYSFYARIGDDSILVQNFIYNDSLFLNRYKVEIDVTTDLLELFSEKFGIYPFYKEKYGHCVAPLGGGMENQTMTTLNTFSFGLVAHELAHQWFGDYVTCSGWQDIWINEGFASYSEYIALEELVSKKAAIGYLTYIHNSAANYPLGGVYLNEIEARNVPRIFNIGLTYHKGASILHMLRYELNDDELFFRILKQYLEAFSNGNASGLDFMNFCEYVSGLQLNWFFDQWYYGKGFPVFTGIWKQTGETLKIESSQTGTSPETPFFKTHMDFKMIFDNGLDTTIKVLFDDPEEIFTFKINKKIKYLFADPDEIVLKTAVFNQSFPEGIIFTLSPNPFIDSLVIGFRDNNKSRTISIAGLNGVEYFNTKTTHNTIQLDLSFLSKGLFLLTVNEDGIKSTEKIIKQ